MTGYYCPSCMLTHLSPDDCSLLRGRFVPEPEVATRDDALEAIVLRLHRTRAALRGALSDLHAAGLEPSQVTRELIPDPFEP